MVAWDFDHCFVDGRVSDEVAGIIAGLTDVVWCERSMSGDGLHVFVLAPEGKGSASPGVEFYSRARFIRVTGDRYVI